MTGLRLGEEAQKKYDEARTNPDHKGQLEKKGAKRKNWNERTFVLKENYLFYSKNPKSQPQGIINLHGCTVAKTEGPTSKPFSFSLMAPKSVSVDAKWTNRTYHMAAKDEKALNEWIRILKEAGRRAAENAAKRNAPARAEEPAAEPDYDEEEEEEEEKPKKKKKGSKKAAAADTPTKKKKKKKVPEPEEEEEEEEEEAEPEPKPKKKKKKKPAPVEEEDDDEEEPEPVEKKKKKKKSTGETASPAGDKPKKKKKKPRAE